MKEKDKKQYALIDNNILDKPLYVANSKYWDIKISKIKDADGTESDIYIATKKFLNPKDGSEAKQILISKNRLPTHQDNLILNTLIHMAQKKADSKLITSIYEILKNLNLSTGKKYYDMVRDSINLWYNFGIEFHNCFYTHAKGHITLKSRIITHFEERIEDGKMEIHFQSKIYELLLKNKFYTALSLPDYKNLKSAFYRRLYELLIKSFNKELSFPIKWSKLRDKLEDDSKYKSTFMKKLKRAVQSINEKTELIIDLKIHDDIIVFWLKNEEKAKLLELVHWLYNQIDDDTILLKIKNTCRLKKNGENFLMICSDEYIRDYFLSDRRLINILKAFKIDKIL